jgi:hypothetical protein
MNLGAAKIVLATVTVLGVVLTFVEKWFAPTAMILEGPDPAPAWVGWLAFIAASFGAIGYILIDVFSSKGN